VNKGELRREWQEMVFWGVKSKEFGAFPKNSALCELVHSGQVSHDNVNEAMRVILKAF